MPRIVSQFNSLDEVLFGRCCCYCDIYSKSLTHYLLDFLDSKRVFLDNGKLYDCESPQTFCLYLLTIFQIYGQIVNLAPLKYVVLASIFLFELGSLFCGIAFNVSDIYPFWRPKYSLYLDELSPFWTSRRWYRSSRLIRWHVLCNCTGEVIAVSVVSFYLIFSIDRTT